MNEKELIDFMVTRFGIYPINDNLEAITKELEEYYGAKFGYMANKETLNEKKTCCYSISNTFEDEEYKYIYLYNHMPTNGVRLVTNVGIPRFVPDRELLLGHIGLKLNPELVKKMVEKICKFVDEITI